VSTVFAVVDGMTSRHDVILPADIVVELLSISTFAVLQPTAEWGPAGDVGKLGVVNLEVLFDPEVKDP
jgi:hypothetical protein